MRLASFVLSFCLHAGFVLLVLFWPAPTLRKLEAQPMTVSLVDGLPGGNRTPSPILGPPGLPERQPAPPPPAPPSREPPPPTAPATPREAAPIPMRETPPPRLITPEPAPQPVPEPAPQVPPEPDAALLADTKRDEPKKPEAPKADTKKEEPKKPETPKAEDKKAEPKQPEPRKPAPPKANPVEEALNKARAAAKSPVGELRVKPNAVAQALALARKHSGGGGGGEGEGEGGGGIGDVYAAQIVMAVQPNWSWPAQAKGDLSVALYLKIDSAGRVLDVRVEESSGNSVFDSSAVSAVRLTQVLPPPPSPAYREMILRFFPMQ